MQGLGVVDLNVNDIDDEDDCVKLDCDDADESFHNNPRQELVTIEVLDDRRFDVVPLQPLRDMRRGAHCKEIELDFTQVALDWEEDTTHLFESKVSDFQFKPPPIPRHLSIDAHEIHSSHIWNKRRLCK